MKLGNLQFDHPLILAPMSGITDYVLRRLAREMGCGLAFTEMLSAEGLLRKGESLLRLEKEDHPTSVQLFSSSPDVLAEAAEMAEAMGADAIDINMGCPARQVVETGAGVGLMRSPDKVERMLVEVRRRLRIPLTIKIRSGWDREHLNAVEISKIAEGCGVDVITLHPRTKVQGFGGRADWGLIREVRRTVFIPVIGNGDVTTPFLAKRMMKETGCDGVMIGRGALGNPWIFRPEGSALSGKGYTPSLRERKTLIGYHFSLLRDYYGDRGAMREFRRHLVWYTRGLPYSASFRSKLSGIEEREALFEAIRGYFNELENMEGHAHSEAMAVTGRVEPSPFSWWE
ncbi:MAG: tRNA dihydrouridine synthase DusB [Syntrophaceae bacterium]|nr:tRNA dihydrouridine synthase DusB [Syntrophaceae bacterium]